MAKKFYAVRKGHNTGIFETWDECKENTSGYSGAEYKSFGAREEAEAYMENEDISKKIMQDSIDVDTVIAYVDGSFDESKGLFSYGAVILDRGNEITFSEAFDDETLISMRNVAGEIKGSTRAMQYCVDNNISKLDLYYDYEGIEKWCTGVWQAKKPGTKVYRDYYNDIKFKVAVNFIKVKAHSGDKYNDMADKLAKEAIQLKQLNKMSSSTDEKSNEVLELFYKAMKKKTKTKNTYDIRFRNLTINQNKIKKFIDELIKSKGYKKSDILKTDFQLDVDSAHMFINIEFNNDNQNYIIKL